MKSHASMNRVYRLVWSADSGTWVPVSELANGRGKSSGLRGVLRKTARLAAVCVAGALAVPSYANGPTGGQVVSGTVNINQSLPNQTQINQSTQKAIVNWNSFSIGADHSVQFNLPNQSAISLNRVTGNQASSILGTLSSNGQVWLLNPNGVLIGQGGSINSQGFLASTRALSDDKFLAGQYEFSGLGMPGSSVINAGEINSAQGGYAVLSGQTVLNQGLVQARLGKVVLAGAESFTIDVVGDQLLSFQVAAGTPVEQLGQQLLVENRGTLAADGGQVLLSAQSVSNVLQGVVNVGGLTQANSVTLENGTVVLGQVKVTGGELSTVNLTGQVSAQGVDANQQGGSVHVTGERIALTDTARFDASGQTGGGEVLVGAGWHGEVIDTQPIAININVAKNAKLIADATVKGNGGDVVVFSDLGQKDGVTIAAGSFSARGAGVGGNGGRIETSGHAVKLDGIQIDASSAQGKAGQWLIDPTDVLIDQTMADAISNGLNTADVLVETTSMGSDFGDITVAANIIYSGIDARTLTLKANRDVLFTPGSEIRSTAAPLNTILWADSDSIDGGRIYMPVNSGIYSFGGRILLGGGFGDIEPFSSARGRAEFVNNVPHGIGLFGANLISNGGDITLRGDSANLTSEQAVSDDAGTLIAANSRVSGVVVGTSQNEVGFTGSVIDTGSGRLDIYGFSNSSFGEEGAAVYIHPFSTVRAAGNPNVFSNIAGYAQNSTTSVFGSSRVGVFNQGTIDANGSNLYITGFGGNADYSAGVKQWGNFLFDSGFSLIQGGAGLSNLPFDVVNSGGVSFLNGVTGSFSAIDPATFSGLAIYADTLHVGANIQNISYSNIITTIQDGSIDLGGVDVFSFSGGASVLGLERDELSRISTNFLYLGTSAQSSTSNVGVRVNTPLDFAGLSGLQLYTPGAIELNADIAVKDFFYVFADNVLLSGAQRNITTQNGGVYFDSAVNSNFNFSELTGAFNTALNINTGNGFVQFMRNVGAINPLGSLTVNSGGIYLYGDIYANQAADISGTFDYFIPEGVNTDFSNNRDKTTNLILSLSEGGSVEVGTTIVPGSSNVGAASLPSDNPKASNNLAGAGTFTVNNEDTYLAVYKDGIKVAENDDAGGGAGSYLNFQVPEGGAGTYMFSFGCFSTSSNCGGTAAYQSIGGGDSSSINLNGFTYFDTSRVLRSNTVNINGHLYSGGVGTNLKFDASETAINANLSAPDVFGLTALGSLSVTNESGGSTILDSVTVDGRLNLNVSGMFSASSLAINNLKVIGETNLNLNASTGTFLSDSLVSLGGVVSVNSNQSVVLNNQKDTFLGSSNVTGSLSVNSLGQVTQLNNTLLNIGQDLSIQSMGDLRLDSILAAGNIDLISNPGMAVSQPIEMTPVTTEPLIAVDSPPPEMALVEPTVSAGFGDIFLNKTVQSTAGNIKIVSANNFTSNVIDAPALLVGSGSRYLVYSKAPELNRETGLSYDFRQHGVASLEDPVLGTGNGFLYSDNYFVSVVAGQTFSKQYDGTANLLSDSLSSISVSGFFDGDIANFRTTDPATFDGINAGSQAEIFASQLEIVTLSNQGRMVYGALLNQETSSSITGTIDPKQLMALLNGAVTKVYDGTTTVLNAGDEIGLFGLVDGEQIDIENAFGEYTTKNAGFGIGVSVDLTAATYSAGTNTLLTNYILPQTVVSGDVGEISQRSLAVSYTGVNKTYDATTTAQVNSIDDRIMGDDLVIGQSAAFVDKNAGTAKQINVTEIALSGVDAQNYFFAGSSSTGTAESIFTENIGPAAITSTTTTADISRKAVDIALTGSVSKIDNGDTVATLLPSNYLVSGLLGDDTLTVNQTTGTYASSSPAQGILVSVALNNANLSNTNYSVVNNSTVVSAPIGTINAAVSKSIAVTLTSVLKTPVSNTPTATPTTTTTTTSTAAPTPESTSAPTQTSATSDTDSGDDSDTVDSQAQDSNGTVTTQTESTSTTSSSPNTPVQTATVVDAASTSTVTTTVVAPPGGSNNSTVAESPPSPVGNTKPATPVDVADSGDGTLTAVKTDSQPKDASNDKRQVTGVTVVTVNGVSTQKTIQPNVPVDAAKSQRFSLTGNYQ